MYRVKSNAVWFNLPGVVAAYQPIMAPDPLLARANVRNDMRTPGQYAAQTVGLPTDGKWPTWSPVTGWGFTAGSTQYLMTGIIPADAWSVLLRIANATNSTQIPLGVAKTSGPSGGFYIINANGGATIQYANGSYGTSVVTKTPSLQSGVVGFAAKSGYRNGVNEANIAAGSGAYGALGIFIGAANIEGSPLYYFTGSTPAVLVASRTFTPAEMWLASSQMKYCHVNPDWSAWGQRRSYYYAPADAVVHELVANAISTAAPVLDTPALSQVHAISGISISTGAPTLGTPAITQVHALTATGIVTGAPTLGTPVAAETHALTATEIATGAPTLGTPAITQVHALTATGIATGAPTLGTPVAAETHALTATEISTGTPTLGTPAITQVHALTGTEIATGAPSLALPAISQVHVLVAMIMVIGAASVGNPYLVQGLMVAPSSRTFSVPAETRSNSVSALSRTRTA